MSRGTEETWTIWIFVVIAIAVSALFTAVSMFAQRCVEDGGIWTRAEGCITADDFPETP